MKHTHLTIALAGLLTAASASAQSSATVFGVADAAIRHTTNGSDAETSLASGGLAGSRFGIRVEEDLGGGLKAGGWIEGTVNLDNGTANATRLWNRRTTVSLSGPMGEVVLGRSLTPGYTAFGEYDTFGTSGLADQGKFHSTAFGSGIEGTGLWARADNAVAYNTPKTLGGFYANAMWAAGEGVVASAFKGTRLGYAAGPLDISGAYSVIDATAGDFTRTSLAARYDFGVAKLFASMVVNKYLDAERRVTQLGVHVPVGTQGTVRANITRADASGQQGATSISADDATQLALGYVHALSKRTSLYGTYARITNKGAAKFAVGTPPAAVAGQASRGIEFGLSHRF